MKKEILKLSCLFVYLMCIEANASKIYYCRGTTEINTGSNKSFVADDVRIYNIDMIKKSKECRRYEKINVCKFLSENADEDGGEKYFLITKLRINIFTRRVSENSYKQRDESLISASFNGTCELAEALAPD